MAFVDALGEPALRLGVFAFVLAAMAGAEILAPRRDLAHGRGRRWLTNFSIVVIDALAVRLIFPLAAVGVALWAESRGIGVFNVAGLPGVVAGVLAFLALDLAIWAQHIATHKIPVLWRIHRVHHSDVDVDFTTGIRFHPVEILLSMLWKSAVIVAIGAPALAVFLFEVVLNAMAMFNHANLRLPARLDRVLRLAIVTPDMHRVHHSVIHRETDANYGFNLSLWDRLFGTYIAQPARGHEAMTLGLDEYQGEEPTRLGWSLRLPLAPLRRRRDGDGQ